MADGGSVIFKFLGDDKELKKTVDKISSVGKTAFKGMVARNNGSSDRFHGYGNG